MEFKNRKTNKKTDIFDDSLGSRWLHDGDWSEPKHHRQTYNKNAFDKGKDDEKVDINIRLSLPKANLDKLKSLKRKISKGSQSFSINSSKINKRHHVTIVVGILILAISAVGFTIYKKSPNDAKDVAGSSSTADPQLENLLPKEKPSYKILYPGSKSEETIGDIWRISPPDQKPAYTFVDQIGGIQIQVTQQQIPDTFKSDPEGQLASLSKANYQTDIFQVDSVTVYSGKSTTGAQSVAFIKGNLLIFIKSANLISEEGWVAYISALHN